ncbi:uncharacterized protein LOC113359322 [Papaver somniferum]|uniref:uncharacterized protein LOC113359322 n=1 Tax=Papaver somniferum TaxID=3469 RepID=UPI000E6F5D9B|nr:uncharacterized protein LOC113359322 [Papaver somniferum]
MASVWTIWKDRCTKVFQNVSPNIFLSIDCINKLSSAVPTDNPTVNSPEQRLTWKPPENDFLKINFNASFVQVSLHGGIGLIVRDFAGDCIKVQGKYLDGGMRAGIEVEELECKSMLEVVKFAVTKMFREIVFESDSEVLIKSISEQTSYVHWMNQYIVLDIKYFLSKLNKWQCVFVKRDANG